MGTDCVLCRRPFVKRDVLLAADAIYKGNAFDSHARDVADHATCLAELHGLEDGTIPATFQIIFLVRTWLQIFPYNELSSMPIVLTDRMETVAESAETAATRKRTDEFEGCLVVALIADNMQ